MRQIVLDTETTGLEVGQGHRIIEIGAVEIRDRKVVKDTHFHHYLNPERDIEEAAMEIHGITLAQLKDKPKFENVAEQLLEFLKGAELIIHNAAFDVRFLNAEFERAGVGKNVIGEYCEVTDTLSMARREHPGQSNNLDALCRRYEVDNTQRTLHGALLDAEILADVYLAMTSGQTTLLQTTEQAVPAAPTDQAQSVEGIKTPLIVATAEELRAHEKWLQLLEKESQNGVVWRNPERVDRVDLGV